MNLQGMLLTASLLVIFAETACDFSDQPVFVEYRRPKSVPPDAILVSSGKGGWWKRCIYDEKRDVDRCEVFNWRGGILLNEVFLPYDGGPPIPKAELRISRKPREPVDYSIELENGRILLPQSRFKKLKAFMDRLK